MDCGSRPRRSQLNGVRVVAKLVHGSDGDSDSMCVSFSESDDPHAIVSICPTRNTERSVYKLDYCYEEAREVHEIYDFEIKPLVQELFDGTNCCVISYGTQQSWPTQLFQGSGENPSLAEITISEILNKNAEGIEISDYEFYGDKIYDLFEVKEEGVQLTSLSKVKVNKVHEFKNLYCKSNRLMRGHRGLVIYISNTSKLNFLELGGYEGAPTNGSLYSVMNIVYALNSKNHISYRDSRLTHQLHNFLSWESRSVVLACLSRSNSQQNMRALRLASNSSQVANTIQFNIIRRPTKHYVTPLERSEKPAHIGTPKRVGFSSCTVEEKTPNASSCLGFGDSAIADMSREFLVARTTAMKKSLKKGYLTYINSANKEDLKRLKGIGEVRANRILQLRDNNPKPFKDVEDLKNVGITPKQFDMMWKNVFQNC